VREFLSKSIAGGLSAGVVLLWWPVLFERVDTVTSWFVRGVAWTVCFELLLFALIPFERALWETTRGERLSSRVGAAGSRLHSGSHRKRMSRLSLVASLALVIPVVLLVTGLQEHVPAQAEAKAEAKPVVRPIKVVRVTKVVRVKRVVQRAPAYRQPVTNTTTPPGPGPASPAPTRSAPPASTGETVVGRTAPVQRQSPPREPTNEPAKQQELTQGDTGGCEGDACGSGTPPRPAPSF
jgi:hypothetical protein